jgi:EAL domain-containing protein (putative c-di-GMP-specific phosphodiesterase class I)/GGDEF domain-containing protein
MRYVIEYEATALLFLSFVMFHYFQKRSIPSDSTRLFSVVFFMTAASLTTDIITAITIEYVFFLPFWVNYLLNTLFYTIQILLPVSMLIFVMSLAEIDTQKNLRRSYLLALPLAGFQIIALLLNPFTKAIFYIDPQIGYVHGQWFFAQYVVSGIYMLLILAFCVRYREKLTLLHYRVIMISIAGILLVISIQIMFPHLLLIGVAVTIAVITMFYNLQNPRDIKDFDSGVFNAAAMRMFLKECEKGKRPINMLALEIDNLYQIERFFGFETLGQVLYEIGLSLSFVSKKLYVFRLSDVRFVALTFSERDFELTRAVIEQRVQNGWRVDGEEVNLSLTVCCIRHLPTQNAVERFPAIIEATFLQAEKSGLRGSFFTAEDAFLSGLHRNVAVDFALNHALREGNGISFALQPIYSLTERRFKSAEVLLRYHHPDLGDVPPDEIFEIAERNGLIFQLDRTMVGLAGDFLIKALSENALGIDSISINLSAVDFINTEIPQNLAEILLQKGVDPRSIIFEITETASVTSPGVLAASMKCLKEQGFRFALDDFGTGFANMTQLFDLPFDIVKLDHRMLTGAPLVFEHLISMVSSMGVSLLVEGVETEQQAKMIENFTGICCAQGYYYAEPMPPDAFVEFLCQKNNPPQE